MARRTGIDDNRRRGTARWARLSGSKSIDRERRRNRARVAERVHLERAVELLKENLVAAAEALRDTQQAPTQTELLGRIERFTAMIRYGLRMLGEFSGEGLDGPSTIAGP